MANFFPDDEELMRQAMLGQQIPMTDPVPEAAIAPEAPAPTFGGGIATPKLFERVLQQMQSIPLAAQAQPAPMANDLLAKYGDQLKGIQQQMGMGDISPEKRQQINDGLRMQAFFADRKRSLTGQPSEQFALQKALAERELNPGAQNFDRLNKSLELLKNLKGIEGSTKDNALKDELLRQSIEEKKGKVALNEVDSEVSMRNRPATKAKLESLAEIARSFARIGQKGKEVPGYATAANEISKLIKEVDNLSYNGQKETVDDARDIVARATGLGANEIDKQAVIINAGKAAEGARHNKAMEDDKDADRKNKQNLHITKAQEKLNREIDDLAETMQQAERLEMQLDKVTVGLGASNVQNVASKIGLAPEAYDRYKSQLGNFRSQYLFGTGGKALSKPELAELAPSIPADDDPKGKQLIKLAEFKEKINRMIQRRQDEYQKNESGQPLDASEVSKKAQGADTRIKSGENSQKVLSDTYKKNGAAAKGNVSKSKLDAYAKQYGKTPEEAAASLKAKGYNVEGY